MVCYLKSQVIKYFWHFSVNMKATASLSAVKKIYNQDWSKAVKNLERHLENVFLDLKYKMSNSQDFFVFQV